MKRLWCAVLLFLVPVSAAGQEPTVQNALPNPADFIAAGPFCERRVAVSPIVTTPGVNWPLTYQCVLDIHTCEGVKVIRSSERPGGEGMCDDYRSVYSALAQREICCDAGEREDEEDRPAIGAGEDAGNR
jgi:hypothetical protein